MASPFSCGCGAATCTGQVQGFAYLTQEQRDRIRPWLSPFIAEQFNQLQTNAGASVS